MRKKCLRDEYYKEDKLIMREIKEFIKYLESININPIIINSMKCYICKEKEGFKIYRQHLPIRLRSGFIALHEYELCRECYLRVKFIESIKHTIKKFWWLMWKITTKN